MIRVDARGKVLFRVEQDDMRWFHRIHEADGIFSAR